MDTPKFVADVHLAKLAKGLRLLGFDTLYFSFIEDSELCRIAQEEGRTVLSKDRRLCQECERCYLVQNRELKAQLKEILKHLQIERCYPFRRCLIDNGLLEPVEKKEIFHLLPPKVKAYYDEFYRCPKCGRIYWRGSHWERMRALIDEVCGEIRAQGL